MANLDILRGEIIPNPADYHIQPKDITEIPTKTGFQDPRTAVSAMWVVALCQKKGGWYSFHGQEIDQLYQEAGGKNLKLHGLVEPLEAWDRWERKQADGGYLAREVRESTLDGVPGYQIVTYSPTTAFVEAVTKYSRVFQPA